MKPLFVEERAGSDIEEITNYYEDIQNGLGVEFQSVLKDAFLVIRQTPDAFGYDSLTKCRTYKIKRFSHIVHYRHEEQGIYVMAVVHEKRLPGFWLS